MYSIPSYDNYDFYFDAPTGIGFAAIAIAIVFAFLILFAVAVLSYVFYSVGMYTLAKKRGMKNAYLAFIPVANTYLLGKVADDINLTMNKKSNFGQKLLITYIPVLVFSELYSLFFGMMSAYMTTQFSRLPIAVLMVVLLICLVVLALCVCLIVFMYMSLNKIYKEYSPKKATTMLVLSIIFPILVDIFIFAIRNKKSGYQLWCEEQAALRARREQEEAALAANAEDDENVNETVDTVEVTDTVEVNNTVEVTETVEVNDTADASDEDNGEEN